jgi:hypothetical protein
MFDEAFGLPFNCDKLQPAIRNAVTTSKDARNLESTFTSWFSLWISKPRQLKIKRGARHRRANEKSGQQENQGLPERLRSARQAFAGAEPKKAARVTHDLVDDVIRQAVGNRVRLEWQALRWRRRNSQEESRKQAHYSESCPAQGSSEARCHKFWGMTAARL